MPSRRVREPAPVAGRYPRAQRRRTAPRDTRGTAPDERQHRLRRRLPRPDGTPAARAATPTQPVPIEPPVTPPSPYAPPDAGAPDPWAPPPADPAPYGPPGSATNPYGTGPSPDEQPAWVQQPYGSTAYGQAPYALPPASYAPPPGKYAPPPAKNTSTVVLTILSGVATVLCCLLGLPSLVLGVVALTRQSTDPGSAARLTATAGSPSPCSWRSVPSGSSPSASSGRWPTPRPPASRPSETGRSIQRRPANVTGSAARLST